ncbi:MAG: hypothetical protein ACK5DD_13200 [Cyclobacteriaceae bacterium]|jgi:hypothetical protein
MNKLIFVALAVLIAIGCSGKKDFAPSVLTPQQQDEKMWKIIRYLAKPPEGLLPMEVFYPQYDSFYRAAQSLHRLDGYYRDGEVDYFLVSRRAPSIKDKRVATGIRMKFDEQGNLAEYEEVFRTWKMEDEVLKKKSLFLFEIMVSGGDLTRYYTANNSEEYIEFPDARTYFDKAERKWKIKEAN